MAANNIFQSALKRGCFGSAVRARVDGFVGSIERV